eukprot:TRINITY_DN1437_c0_g1_i3.p1 TRINITY_DN1437_c0_g1~~TRINITY_DN1437_c0_g1_i3.p1  ORF type:complete len:179 (-),score=18.44 TRINITY_DN1437_c0_g1_i3:115-651(-)
MAGSCFTDILMEPIPPCDKISDIRDVGVLLYDFFNNGQQENKDVSGRLPNIRNSLELLKIYLLNSAQNDNYLSQPPTSILPYIKHFFTNFLTNSVVTHSSQYCCVADTITRLLMWMIEKKLIQEDESVKDLIDFIVNWKIDISIKIKDLNECTEPTIEGKKLLSPSDILKYSYWIYKT